MTLWSMTPVSKQAKLVNRVTGRPWTGTGAGQTPKNNFLRSDSAANGRPKVHNYEVMLTSPLVAVTAFLMRVSSTFMSTSACLPGYPASHGCVRMPLAFAKLLYKASPMGMTVSSQISRNCHASPQPLTCCKVSLRMLPRKLVRQFGNRRSLLLVRSL